MITTGNRWADIARLRWRSFSRRHEVEQELDEELRFHHEALIQKHLERGLSAAEAQRQAGIEMGNGVEAIREGCRDARGWSWFENILRDIQYGFRAMLREPLFTLTAVGALAIGIGANSTVFTIIYSLMYRPIPVAHPESMRNVHIQAFGEGPRWHYGTQYFITWDEFNSIRGAAKSADITGMAETAMSRKDDPRPVHAQLVSENLLSVIGAQPVLGRLLTQSEVSSPGSAASVVLSQTAWRDWFGNDPNVLGKQVVLNRTPFTVVGVVDRQTTGPSVIVPDIWIPLTMQGITRPGEVLITNPNAAWIQVFGRLKSGYTDAQMQSEMQTLAHNAVTQHAPKLKVTVTTEKAAFFNYPLIRQKSGPLIAVVFLAVGLVLLVACANVANMLLARGLSRRREIAIRLSIGAGRGRILQQLLTESVLLGVIGGCVGLLMAEYGARAVLSMIPSEMMGRHQLDLSPDLRVLGFTLLASVLTGVIFGLLPAWNSLRFQLSPSLKAEGLAELNRTGKQRLQFALIAVQVAVCLVLLFNANLLLRGLRSALTSSPGQATRNVFVANFDLRQQQYTPEQAEQYITTLRDQALSLPGVRATSSTSVEPLHQQCGNSGSLAGSGGQEGERFMAVCDEIGPDYLKTMSIPLIEGREFTRLDMKTRAKVAIVDQNFAKRYFPGGSALRHVINYQGVKLEIVGIAAVTNDLDFGGMQGSKVYTPMLGLRHLEAKIVGSYDGRWTDIQSAFTKTASSLDPNVTVRLHPIEESVSTALVPAKMSSAAGMVLSGFALILAASGIYGVVAFAITRRRKEMGIRVALGAERSSVMRLMLWQGLQPVVAGTVLGFALAAAAANLIRAMLYGVSPFDPTAFVTTAGILVAVAGVAALLPARSAMQVNPASVLREE